MTNGTQDKVKSKMAWVMLLAMWLIIFALLAWFFARVLDHQNNPNQNISSRLIGEKIIEVMLLRNKFGHYLAMGEINGEAVELMLDTGATGVIIPGYMATSLGLKKGMPVTVHTANGKIVAYMSTLDQVSIGDIKLTNVKALINPSEKSSLILLGMSFLKYIEFTQRGDTLTLRQYKNE